MEYFLLFYRIIFYTFGFSLLIFTVYKYVTTRNNIVGSFLFLWSSMTAIAASYILNYYIRINLKNINYMIFYIILQYISIMLTSISLPMFIQKIFKIKRNYVINIIIITSSITLILLLVPPLQELLPLISTIGMFTILISNIYSFTIATKRILIFENRSNKKMGTIFLLTFAIRI